MVIGSPKIVKLAKAGKAFLVRKITEEAPTFVLYF
jgi:hypothetical protein